MVYPKSLVYFVSLLTFILIGAGCKNNIPPEVATTTPKEPVSTSTVQLSPNEVKVSSVEIMELESFPVQVVASVQGYVAKCVKLGEPKVNLKGNRFLVDLNVAVLGTVCKEKNASVSFQNSVKLDVYGLKKGTYTVEVGDVKKEFVLTQDNILETLPPTSTDSASKQKIK